MSEAEIKALVRELKSLKRAHDELGDRIADMGDRLDALLAEPAEPPAIEPKGKEKGDGFLGIKN